MLVRSVPSVSIPNSLIISSSEQPAACLGRTHACSNTASKTGKRTLTQVHTLLSAIDREYPLDEKQQIDPGIHQTECQSRQKRIEIRQATLSVLYYAW